MSIMTEHGVGKVCQEGEHAILQDFRASIHLELPLKEHYLQMKPHHKTNAA